VAFAYDMAHPIPIARDQPQRLYLINVTEFDPINSFHLHGNFFDYYDHGTTLEPTHRTVQHRNTANGESNTTAIRYSFVPLGVNVVYVCAFPNEIIKTLQWPIIHCAEQRRLPA